MCSDRGIFQSNKSTLPDDTPLFRQGCVTYIIVVLLQLWALNSLYKSFGLYVPLLIIIIFMGLIVYGTYVDWYNEIRTRKSKEELDCPSNGYIPEVTNIPAEIKQKHQIIEKEVELVEKVFRAHVEPARHVGVDADGHVVPDPAQSIKDKIANSGKWGKFIKDKKVHRRLDMDHVKIAFFDQLKTMFFLLPNSAFYAVEGVIKHAFFCSFTMMGIKIFQRKVDYDFLTVEMILETSMCVFYNRILNEVETRALGVKVGNKVGLFEVKRPILLYTHDTVVHNVIRILVDLTDRKYVSSSLDDKPLTSKDTSVLLSFILVTSHHVKIHSYANWGIDPYHSDPELRWLSSVTVAYNRYGFDAFPKVAWLLRTLGFLAQATKNIQSVFQHGIDQGIHYHANLIELVNYSDFIRFIYGVRGHFLNEFAIVKKEYFPGINGQAYFIGTVIHSLDHTQYTRIWADTTWPEVDNKDFKHMATISGIVVCGFTGDLPMLMYNYRFKDLKRPFFQNIYHHAYKIDPYMADHMDATVIK